METMTTRPYTWGDFQTATFSNYETWRVWVDVVSQLEHQELLEVLSGLNLKRPKDKLLAAILLADYFDKRIQTLIYPPDRKAQDTVIRGWAERFVADVYHMELADVALENILALDL